MSEAPCDCVDVGGLQKTYDQLKSTPLHPTSFRSIGEINQAPVQPQGNYATGGPAVPSGKPKADSSYVGD